jgi:ubiquinone/menaquinone biosynthesis C-methylase UbiE
MSIAVPEPTDQEQIRDAVRRGYSQIAQSGSLAVIAGGCCGSADSCDSDALAGAIGYSVEELAALPAGTNMGLSCGNPTALASLAPGEVVLDLGSGGGFDVFLAGPRVGVHGRAIGVDMTPEMISKARRNTAVYRQRIGLDNVEFRLGEIEHLPSADNSVDCVISNCVINLSPDKPQVWREMFRVLRPGGRVAVSDLHLLRPLPAAVQNEVAALIGCIAGASLVEDARAVAEAAGFEQVELTLKSDYVAAMISSNDALYKKLTSMLPPGATPADYVTSVDITARKPGATPKSAGTR